MLSKLQQQYFLKYNGNYYTGKLDGKRGTQHKAAVKRYQLDKGLTPDSAWGIKTNAAAIEDAKRLQQKLNLYGYKLVVDGIIGEKTVAAIKSFQKANGLVEDGIAGILTWAKLNRGLTWDSIRFFKKDEFRCPCGECDGFPAEPNLKLVGILDQLREEFGTCIITSGIRCKTYNNSLTGSSPVSAHMYGKAADIYIAGICDTKAGRKKLQKRAKELGASYCYSDTPNMGSAVHIQVA